MALNMKRGGPEEHDDVSIGPPQQEQYNDSYQRTSREKAPRAGRNNPIPTWLTMSETVQVTPEIKSFMTEISETIPTNYGETLLNFSFSQCSNPKSVYWAKASDINGIVYAFGIVFAEMVGSEVPPGAPKSVALEIGHATLVETNPGIRVAGLRVITRLDLQNNRSRIIDDIAKSIVTCQEGRGQSVTAGDLSEGTSTFTLKSDLNEVRSFFRERSPHSVLPAMNAGIVLSWAGQSRDNGFGGRNDEYASNKPILAVAVMIDFVQTTTGNGRRYEEETTYTPNVRITGVDAIYPNPGLLFLGILFAIEKMVSEDGWMDAFYNAHNSLAGDPGNLFRDPDDPDTYLRVDPQDQDVFWRKYRRYFTDPIVTLDVEFGRRSIPFLFNFAAAAQGKQSAEDRITDEMTHFFNDNGQFAKAFNLLNTPIAVEFATEHTGVVSLKDNHHIDSREITLLSAMAGIVGSVPTGDALDVLLNPNQVDAYAKDSVMTSWLGSGSFTPLYSTKTVVLTGQFIDAAARAATSARLSVDDPDNRRSRVLFSGRNNAAEYAYSGAGLGIINRNDSRGRYSQSWSDQADDWTV